MRHRVRGMSVLSFAMVAGREGAGWKAVSFSLPQSHALSQLETLAATT
jgi:hypothetical protein